ncbi:glycosyltransferase [Vibrio rumoiensis]|uniref:glycosyltransferase n=1 Tax=Vibrio rumoiensis TaxID=76258 RepID=UPI00374A49A2
MKRKYYQPGLVSIYIPTRNRKELLINAVDSVLRQTYRNIEIIIIDDCSRDETESVVKEYMLKHDFIYYLKNDEPKGACYSRNRAINFAKGEFITGLDDDDIFLDNRIQEFIDSYENKYTFLCTPIIENNGKRKIVRNNYRKSINLDSLLHSNVVGNQIFTKTQFLQEIGGFDKRMPAFQDYDTWIRLLYKNGYALKLQKPTYIWNTGHELDRISLSSSNRLKAIDLMIDNYFEILNKEHKESWNLLRLKVKGENFNINELKKVINRHNFIDAIKVYLLLKVKR